MSSVQRKTPVNLLTATKEERQSFLDSIDYVMTDCDGTVWDLTKPFDGANEAVAALKAKGKKVVYVSNNATRTGEYYDKKFQAYKFDANFKNDVIHPGTAAVDYLRSIDFQGAIYCIGSTCLKNLLTEAGLDLLKDDCWSPMEESLAALLSYISAPIKASAVVLDFDYNINLKQIHRAQRLLHNPDCKFIALATDWEIPVNPPVIGPGVIIKLLEDATQRQATVVGKPGAALRDIILAKYKITDPKRILFVGDTLSQDVGFGSASGFQTLAVLFCRTEEQVLSHSIPGEIPDFWLPRFADFNKVLADLS